MNDEGSSIEIRVAKNPAKHDPPPETLVLGIDVGFRKVAFVIVAFTRSSMRTVFRETFETTTSMGSDEERLNMIARRLIWIFGVYGSGLDAVGFENQAGFAAGDGGGQSASSRRLLEVQGIIRAVCVSWEHEPYAIAISTLKVAILGKGGGHAKKNQLKPRVQQALGWKRCSEHEVDAAGAAFATYTKHLEHRANLRRNHARIS